MLLPAADTKGRSNIGNARLAGLEKELHLKGLMYNVAVAVFFPTYAAGMAQETAPFEHEANIGHKLRYPRI